MQNSSFKKKKKFVHLLGGEGGGEIPIPFCIYMTVKDQYLKQNLWRKEQQITKKTDMRSINDSQGTLTVLIRERNFKYFTFTSDQVLWVNIVSPGLEATSLFFPAWCKVMEKKSSQTSESEQQQIKERYKCHIHRISFFSVRTPIFSYVP